MSINDIAVNSEAINGLANQGYDASVFPASNLVVTTPLNYARIGWENLSKDATLAASSETTGFESDSLQNELTYELWKPSALPATLTYDLGASKLINYIGIAAHTLGASQTTINAEYSLDGVTYTPTFSTATPAKNDAVMMLFNLVSARYVRITFTGATIPVMSVIYIGKTLDMYRPFYSGHTPDTMARSTVVKPNKSIQGAFLGRSLTRLGYNVSYSWDNFPIDWYAANVDPFAISAQKYPFFVAWNILEHPEDCVYCWTSDNIMPSLTGKRNLVQFSFDAEAIGNNNG